MNSEENDYQIIELEETIEDLEKEIYEIRAQLKENEALVENIIQFIEEKKLTQELLLFLMKKQKKEEPNISFENNDSDIPF